MTDARSSPDSTRRAIGGDHGLRLRTFRNRRIGGSRAIRSRVCSYGRCLNPVTETLIALALVFVSLLHLTADGPDRYSVDSVIEPRRTLWAPCLRVMMNQWKK